LLVSKLTKLPFRIQQKQMHSLSFVGGTHVTRRSGGYMNSGIKVSFSFSKTNIKVNNLLYIFYLLFIFKME